MEELPEERYHLKWWPSENSTKVLTSLATLLPTAPQPSEWREKKPQITLIEAYLNVYLLYWDAIHQHKETFEGTHPNSTMSPRARPKQLIMKFRYLQLIELWAFSKSILKMWQLFLNFMPDQ